MKLLRNLLVGAALAAVALLGTGQSGRAASLMCQGDVSGASTGARTIGGTGSAVPSGTLYSLNPSGCALIGPGDVGYFLSQGFTIAAPFGTLYAGSVGAQNTSIVLPASSYIRDIIIQNLTTNAVTGGLKFGSTAGGTDVASPVACGSQCSITVNDVSLVKRILATGSNLLSIDAVSSWNSALVNVTVIYGYY